MDRVDRFFPVQLNYIGKKKKKKRKEMRGEENDETTSKKITYKHMSTHYLYTDEADLCRSLIDLSRWYEIFYEEKKKAKDTSIRVQIRKDLLSSKSFGIFLY